MSVKEQEVKVAFVTHFVRRKRPLSQFTKDGDEPEIGFFAIYPSIIPETHFTDLVAQCMTFYQQSSEWDRIAFRMRIHAEEPPEKSIDVYLAKGISGQFAGYYKIGVSGNPEKRVAQFKYGYETVAELVCTIRAKSRHHEIERLLHVTFADQKAAGASEWFTLSLDDVERVKQLSRESGGTIYL